MHEHVFVVTPEIQANWTLQNGLAWDDAEGIKHAAARLNELHDAGISTLLDMTIVGLGRDVSRIARVAALTDLNIIVATGLYVLNDIAQPFFYSGPGTVLGGPEPLVDLFVGDIEEGIAGTGVKAGVLKCATETAGRTPGSNGWCALPRVRTVSLACRSRRTPMPRPAGAWTSSGSSMTRASTSAAWSSATAVTPPTSTTSKS